MALMHRKLVQNPDDHLQFLVEELVDRFRGRPKGDIEAVVHAAESVAAYAEANRDTILEMAINPLLVLPEKKGVVVADAFIRMAEMANSPETSV